MPQGYVRALDLPQVIPVFPLSGAVVLPRGQLPLNIFEPRYLNMLDDAMSGERVIGMIQTLMHHGILVAGLPYSFQGQMRNDEITGGSPYGATTITNGDGFNHVLHR